MTNTPIWTEDEFREAIKVSIEHFRIERIEEPLEAYLEAFDEYQSKVEELLETTVDLTKLDDHALSILTNPNLLESFRYLPGPPISEDDLKTVAEAVLTPSRLRNNPDMVKRIVQVILAQLDRRRFSWITERREPTESERNAAVLASAALLANQRLSTNRRTLGKTKQEDKVENALLNAGLRKVNTRTVNTLNQAPNPGEFCRESILGSRKADFLVGLYDKRILAIECKVSNSSTNSVKRLNNDAAAKAEAWIKDFGTRQIVPSAVLSGVYKLHNLEDAQSRNLTLFWAHDLAKLINWINSTKSIL